MRGSNADNEDCRGRGRERERKRRREKNGVEAFVCRVGAG